MGYIEIKDTVYQEIAFRTICDFLGLDKEDKLAKSLKKSITVEKVAKEIVSESESGTEGALQDKSIYLLVQLTTNFGTNLIDFANRVSCKIKEEVTNITGTEVLGVNVKIVDLEKVGE